MSYAEHQETHHQPLRPFGLWLWTDVVSETAVCFVPPFGATGDRLCSEILINHFFARICVAGEKVTAMYMTIYHT